MAPGARVLHVSDVHIRAGGRERCRADEYENVIRGLCLAAEEALAPSPRHLRRIVITGDVFHDKGSVGKAGIQLFFALVRGLARTAEVFVIRGNHDFVQERCAPGDDFSDTGDVIEALLSEAPVDGVTYLPSTALAESPPFGFGVLAVQDCCSRGGTVAQDVPCPPLPDPAGFSDRVLHRVALFHGAVPGGGATARWMRGYHVAMLGDVHDRGAWAGPEGAPITLAETARGASWGPDEPAWAYSGSLLQQNHGESFINHGALLWDLDRRTVAAVDVPSPHAFLTLSIPRGPSAGPGARWELSVASTGGLPWGPPRADAGPPRAPLASAAPLLPERATVRVFAPLGYTGNPEAEAAAALLAAGCRATRTTLAHGDPPRPPGARPPAGPDFSAAATAAATAAAEAYAADPDADGALRAFHSPEQWERHVRDADRSDLELADFPFRQWLRAEHAALCVPPASAALPPSKLDERNDRVRKAADRAAEYLDAGGRGAVCGTLALRSLSWRWLLCFGDGSRFDFERARGRVVMINGPNASGKSSFLEVVTLALFGEPPPTRHSKEHSSSCINRRAPLGGDGSGDARPATRLSFRLGGADYVLRREFRRKKGAPGKLGVCGAWLAREDPGGESRELRTGRAAVDRWVHEHVGTLDQFLLSAMVSQDRDSDFFAMRPAEQRDAIDSALCAEGITLCLDAIDEARRAHKWAADSLDTAALSREQALPRGTREAFLESGRSVAEARRRTGAALARVWAAALLSRTRAGILQELPPEAPRADEPPVPPVPRPGRPPGEAARALEEARASLRDARAEKTNDGPEPGAVPLHKTPAERRHDASRPDAPSATLRRRAQKHAERAERISRLSALLDRDRDVGESGPFAPGCPACQQRLARHPARPPEGFDAEAARAEVDEILALKPAERGAHYAAAAAAAEAWEAAEPGWAEIRQAREARSRFLQRAQDIDSRIGAALASVDELQAEADAARAWDERDRWVASRGEPPRPDGPPPRARAEEALDSALSLRADLVADLGAERAALRRHREHRAAVVDRRLRRREALGEVRLIRGEAQTVRARESALRRVHDHLSAYGESTYRSSVSSALEDGVAAVLACMGVRGLSLRAEWGQKGFAFWTEGPGGVSLPLEKASGYQRASLGLGLRIALSRLGASAVTCSQLFLDEAFGSFDEGNRTEVGDFLRGLLSTYESVVLVSHVLPADAGDDGVSIRRTASGDSLLAF